MKANFTIRKETLAVECSACVLCCARWVNYFVKIFQKLMDLWGLGVISSQLLEVGRPA